MAQLAKLLENSVADKQDADVNVVERCAGKTVLLYFSAEWCGPCKNFTPVLNRFYEKYKTMKNFEVIFVSMDNRVADGHKYYSKHMSFLRLRLRNETVKDKLLQTFNVDSIPRLVVINADTGKVLCGNAVTHLAGSDPKGFHFPWTSSSNGNNPVDACANAVRCDLEQRKGICTRAAQEQHVRRSECSSNANQTHSKNQN